MKRSFAYSRRASVSAELSMTLDGATEFDLMMNCSPSCSFRYFSKLELSAKSAFFGTGMLCLCVNDLEKALSPSSLMDFEGAPNTVIPLWLMYSTTPVKRGASVPMKTKSILCSTQVAYTS